MTQPVDSMIHLIIRELDCQKEEATVGLSLFRV